MDAAKKGDMEDSPTKNQQESPSSNFATHPNVCVHILMTMAVDVYECAVNSKTLWYDR